MKIKNKIDVVELYKQNFWCHFNYSRCVGIYAVADTSWKCFADTIYY